MRNKMRQNCVILCFNKNQFVIVSIAMHLTSHEGLASAGRAEEQNAAHVLHPHLLNDLQREHARCESAPEHRLELCGKK